MFLIFASLKLDDKILKLFKVTGLCPVLIVRCPRFGLLIFLIFLFYFTYFIHLFLVAQPMDVIKVRLQLDNELKSNNKTSKKYHGTISGMRTLVLEEGYMALMKAYVE